ncbi:MAG: thiol peroxidase [Negativicutes bacterium]|nr:thiol peroxidase [Negativicutes bacterium]
MSDKYTITFKGQPLTLNCRPRQVGDSAPDVCLTNNQLQPVSLADYRGKNIILSTVPSLDTPVCDIQTRTLNEKAKQLDADTVIITVSRDLPFAQARWCQNNPSDSIITLSDYKNGEFGRAFGLYIDELALLARAVYIIDSQGRICYQQIVPEMTEQPDYEAVLAAYAHLSAGGDCSFCSGCCG